MTGLLSVTVTLGIRKGDPYQKIYGLLLTPGIPHGLIPFAAVIAVEILMTTCLITVVSVTTESHGWTVVVAQVGGLSLNVIGWSTVRLPGIGGTMRSASVQWSETATVLLVAEFAVVAVKLLITFFGQARKRDFI